MYQEIKPDLNELIINILWADITCDETKIHDVTTVGAPSKIKVIMEHKNITTTKRSAASVTLESQEVIETISRDYWS